MLKISSEIETRITAHGIDFSLFEDRNRQYTEGKTVVGLMDDFLGRTPTFPGYFMIPNKAVQEEYSGSYKLRAVFASGREIFWQWREFIMILTFLRELYQRAP